MNRRTRLHFTRVQFSSALLIVAVVIASGCTRGHYRLRADADAYGRLIEKSSHKPWQIPGGYNVYPAPHSRLHDPTCVNDPRLPSPSPQLYDYELPELPERDLARFRPKRSDAESLEELDVPEPAAPASEPNQPEPYQPGDLSPDDFETGPQLFPNESTAPISTTYSSQHVAQPPTPSAEHTSKPASPFQSVSYEQQLMQHALVARAQDIPPPVPVPPNQEVNRLPTIEQNRTNTIEDRVRLDDSNLDQATGQTDAGQESEDPEANDQAQVQATQVPLPPSYWELIPDECLARMFEFETVRSEYAQTYGAAPKESQLDDSPQLALEDIIDLTLLNSRELQTQKESLYSVALALTLERFDYQLKPSFGNNGTATNFNHDRSGGITSNSLSIPTTFQLEKMLYSGADFIGQFANDVLLTFNGPQGFAVDVGSELFFGFSQSLLQRDVQLESLTQSERNVVYAARDFRRFRRELFVQQASDYYSLIRQFRQIEIQCQNYFTLAREFNQRSVEINYGFAARTQLDQVEQQVITGRQSILSACTSLENALDGLKIRMGIPTEQPLNLDLSELNLITLSDELAVNAELIERTRRRIQGGLESEEKSPTLLVATASELAGHMLDSIELRKALGEDAIESAPLEYRLLELRIEGTEIEVAEVANDLKKLLSGEEGEPSTIALFLRRRDIVKILSEKILLQLHLLELDDLAEFDLPEWTETHEEFGRRIVQLRERFLQISQRETDGSDDEVDLDALEEQLIKEAEDLQNDMERFAAELDEAIGRTPGKTSTEFESRSIEFTGELIGESDSFRGAGGGLVPIQIEMDDAMMTALVQRFDLMNQRGFLADDWRLIKYAADDLKSILNLNASQSIRTRSTDNQPFDFTFDDSTTSVGVSLDLPFNRRAQRNSFRTSLFNYQQTLRNVMALEDNIKLSVRQDLRTLKLDRQQYANDIAGAALASERVKGTEAEVRLGQATSRDFLESQQAYVQAISGVADDHINYIVGRLDLFLDLESLEVGDNGFWDKLYDENHQPMPQYQLPGYASPGYGQLHPRLKYSKLIRRMRCVPDGVSMVHREDAFAETPAVDSAVNQDISAAGN